MGMWMRMGTDRLCECLKDFFQFTHILIFTLKQNFHQIEKRRKILAQSFIRDRIERKSKVFFSVI